MVILSNKYQFIDELRYFLERPPTTQEVELYWNRYLNQKEEKDALTWITKHVIDEEEKTNAVG